MRKVLITIIEYAGRGIGAALSFAPGKMIILAAQLLQKCCALSGKLGSFSFIFSNQCIKYATRKRSAPLLLRRKIQGGGTLELDITQKTQRQIFLMNVYEPFATQYFIKYLKRGDTVLDVGANVGYFSILAASLVGPLGHVYAFEPENHNFRRLEHNCQLNSLRNITAIKKAAGSKGETVPFYVNPLNDGGGSIIEPSVFHDDQAVFSKEEIEKQFPHTTLRHTIESTAIDSLGLSSVALVKIDVEGAELDTLRGMRNVLESIGPDIICEVSERGAEIETLVRTYGYTIYSLSPEGIPHPLHGKMIKEKHALFSKHDYSKTY
ncbi:hypothetical protein COU17_02740 [Candidatus Kaiserbacteria bacterium CG10_big_fil_rev_8_21_14_0_10_49_17]|uniref:Methyltransferase FkbM domain-containing protein n=1 Tax=Candidatus Kaiserbacteria bacterium CG10_big_fil_rev_8_21_14_0_10_49_17 TaxID=1974609 RepID=A0A2M6WDW3_9BACT|nr:MAG: hypothetical protein COU17_02740 [Candidatus Kaiserbacteria bacterium CG10_big_fil_rev_8_21_14_0_10_49_17]